MPIPCSVSEHEFDGKYKWAECLPPDDEFPFRLFLPDGQIYALTLGDAAALRYQLWKLLTFYTEELP
jgi:hypothetical protein